MTKQGRAKGSKKSSEPPLPNPQGRWSRTAFTIAPVIVFLLAQQVTLPGVDRVGLERTGMPAEPYSIVAVGFVPLLTAAFLVEVVAAIVPRWRHLRHGGTSGREKLERATTMLAVVFALFQGYQVANFIQVTELASAGIVPTALMTGTLVAGVVLFKLLADLISARGLASGYSVILSVGTAIEIMSALYKGRLSLTWMDGVGVFAKIVAVAVLTWFMMERLRPASGETLTQKREDSANDDAGELNPYAAPKENTSSEEAQDSPKNERQAIQLPVPASGAVPYMMTWSLLATPMIIVDTIPGMGMLKSLFHRGGILFAVVSISVLCALTWVVVALFNQPKRVAEVYGRIPGTTASKTSIEAHAREALRHATAYALLFMVGLVVIEFAGPKMTRIEFSTVGVAIAAAFSMDLMREFRTLGSRQDLVPIWPEHRPYAIAAAKKALEDAGIFVHVRDERQRRRALCADGDIRSAERCPARHQDPE
jgi:preprotein translocase subunit SecY